MAPQPPLTSFPPPRHIVTSGARRGRGGAGEGGAGARARERGAPPACERRARPRCNNVQQQQRATTTTTCNNYNNVQQLTTATAATTTCNNNSNNVRQQRAAPAGRPCAKRGCSRGRPCKVQVSDPGARTVVATTAAAPRRTALRKPSVVLEGERTRAASAACRPGAALGEPAGTEPQPPGAGTSRARSKGTLPQVYLSKPQNRPWRVSGTSSLFSQKTALEEFCKLAADPPGTFSSLGPGPGRGFGKMFLPVGCRREFVGCSREPGPWQAGPPPSHAHGPQDIWDKPPWEHQHRRGRGRWCPRRPWDPRPFPGPANFHGKEEGRWAPHDCPPSPSWDGREDRGGPDNFFGEGWHRPGPWDPRPLPGPADFHGNEEDRRWATHNRAPPPPWDDRVDNQGPEYFGEDWDQPGPWDRGHFPGPADFHGIEEDRRWAPHERHPPPHWNDREDNQEPEDRFGEGWHWEPWSGPSCSAWSKFPGEERHPPCPPASVPREGGGFPDGCPSWGYRGLGVRCSRRLRRGHRELTLIQRLPCSWPSRGNRPFCKSFNSLPGTSQPGVKEQQRSASPQSLMSCKGGVLNGKQTAQDPPAASEKVPEPPRPASSPQKSPATDSQAATEAAEPEQAAEATSVEPGGRQKPAGSHSQVETALETEPVPPEKSPAGTGEQLEVEPCSPSVPKAGAGGGSHPPSPAAPPEPAEKVHTAAGSAGEAGAELCPCSGGEQHLQNGAEEAKGEAACDELLGVLQPSDNSQVLPGATVEPDAQPSQACSDICAAPETSPGTQHLPGSGETEPAADSQHQLCSTLPTPSPASTDLRSAAVLARKEEIELSYQQFSLTIAVVATMLLQKEPSMEAALGLALRANLRQGRIHHLQELEDFIDSYDSATLSR